MKRKDVLYLVLAIIILGATGIAGYQAVMPKRSTAKATSAASYEVFTAISPTLDKTKLSRILDTKTTKDFTVPVDLNGLGNQTPFGPLQ